MAEIPTLGVLAAVVVMVRLVLLGKPIQVVAVVVVAQLLLLISSLVVVVVQVLIVEN